MVLLSLIEHLPSSSQKNESTEDQNIAENMERIEVRIDFPP